VVFSAGGGRGVGGYRRRASRDAILGSLCGLRSRDGRRFRRQRALAPQPDAPRRLALEGEAGYRGGGAHALAVGCPALRAPRVFEYHSTRGMLIPPGRAAVQVAPQRLPACVPSGCCRPGLSGWRHLIGSKPGAGQRAPDRATEACPPTVHASEAGFPIPVGFGSAPPGMQCA
jgi:hypothetical protein